VALLYLNNIIYVATKLLSSWFNMLAHVDGHSIGSHSSQNILLSASMSQIVGIIVIMIICLGKILFLKYRSQDNLWNITSNFRTLTMLLIADLQSKGKVKLSLCFFLTEHQCIGGVEDTSTHS
jgi:hypothetical protein